MHLPIDEHPAYRIPSTRPVVRTFTSAELTRLAISRALERDELVNRYQPIVDLKSRRVVGVEVLVRWRHPRCGWVLPESFIPFAEDSGLIVPITYRVLGMALRDAAAWRARLPALSLAVNLSPVLLNDRRLPQDIETLLREHRHQARHLLLEVTEGREVDEGATPFDVFMGLKNQGVLLALDDFGTGYASRERLFRFPYGALKIDKTFIMSAASNRRAAALVRAILRLGRSAGLRIVAEGVENQGIFDWLGGLDCQWAQGYHIGRPLSSAEVVGWAQCWACETSQERARRFAQPFAHRTGDRSASSVVSGNVTDLLQWREASRSPGNAG